MKRLFALLLAACSLTVLAEPTTSFGIVRPQKTIRLDDTASFEALRQANPAHYERAIAVIDAATTTDCSAVETARVVPATAEARRVGCAFGQWYMSSPPQRDLAFMLDDVQYMTRVTMQPRGRFTPIAAIPSR